MNSGTIWGRFVERTRRRKSRATVPLNSGGLSFKFTPYAIVAGSDPFDTDPDPGFQFNPDPTAFYGSGSLPFQRGNVPKVVLFISVSDPHPFFADPDPDPT